MFILLDNPFDHYDLAFPLSESKSLTSFDTGQDDIRQAVIDAGFRKDPSGWKTNRRAQSSRHKGKFEKLQKRITKGMLNYTYDYQANKISKNRWANWLRHLLREGYQEAFKLGLMSAGVEKARAGVAIFDKKWVSTASKEEMQYLNKLLKEISEGRQRGSVERRLSGYVDALQNIYYSGRVMGTPSNHLIDWIGPNDRNTCESCRFLIKKSPFTKRVLPATPRSGQTKCLNRCRCKLVIREVSKEKFDKVQRRHKSKRWYSEKLLRIKAGKTL